MGNEATMDAEDPDDFAINQFPADNDDDSGSVYEVTDTEHSASNADARSKKTSRANSVKSGASNRSKRPPSERRSDEGPQPLNSDESDQSDTHAYGGITSEEIRQDAVNWAKDFHPPSSPTDIKLPLRQAAGSRSKSKFVPQESSEVKLTRLKGHYNTKYRELLNTDINDTANGSFVDDETPLPGSQIGSSIWASSEKDIFFSALPSLGRDNLKRIATKIGTKTEMEVHEYLLLLQKSATNEGRQGKLLEQAEFPAAFEISEHCCKLLEHSGDALSVRQERQEVKVEQDKWGDSWLLTADVSYQINQRRRQEGGEEAIDEVLPAVNLMNLGTWLELSHRIFMNSASPGEHDNWNSLAEDGETPAIRATAFEDFHSLLVHITKKLVSTTLFCTMSREKAMNAHKIKHAEVSPGDVEAAVNILKMSSSTHEFWKKAARRCNLQVIDDEAKDEAPLEYEEVEAALSYTRSRSRSRSVSRNHHSRTPVPDLNTNISPNDSSDEFESANESPGSYSSDPQDQIPLSPSENNPGHYYRQPSPSNHFRDQDDYLEAQEEYIDSLDLAASRVDESRLWSILERSPPPMIKPEPLDEPVKPRSLKRRLDGANDWREYVGYRSEWEELDMQITEEAFTRNRELQPKRRRRAHNDEHWETGADSVDGEHSRSFDDEADDEEQHSERVDMQSVQPTKGYDSSVEVANQNPSSDAENEEGLNLEHVAEGTGRSDFERSSGVMLGYSSGSQSSENIAEEFAQHSASETRASDDMNAMEDGEW